MNKKKVMIAAIVLALVLSIGGILAFFTDQETATNVFTIGNVDITLTEPNWVTTDSDNDNVPDAAQGRMPGQTVAKNPTITNTGDNNAYVFMEVISPCTEDSPAKEIFLYTSAINSGWYLMTASPACDSTTHTITRVYAYGDSSTGMTSVAKNGTATLFNSVTVNDQLTGDTAEGLTGNKNIVVNAYAIQADGLGLASDTPANVWPLAH